MANPAHFAKLMEGWEAWNAWKSEPEIEIADLSDARLDGFDFSQFVLSVTNLERASLRGARLTNTQMAGVLANDSDWSGARFENVRFVESTAQRATFDDALFLWTRFDESNLDDASFVATDFFETIFTDCRMRRIDLSRARLSTTTIARSIFQDVRGLDTARSATLSIGIDTLFDSGGLPEEFLR
ncbi:MAG TPA: pentapeptide repeat-containing protein, partial [Thermoanaerobaculia bacterium]|nr:pentapeptide repeat-containing protein [Thermoanaerobaculia bacterium]